MNAPGFWDDQNRAATVSSEHARASRKLEGYNALVRDYDDARELAAMDAGELEGEIAAALAPLRRELDRLQEAALFNGEYDAGDAVVTLQSGTGGTDAQDWAEMMLRMYERWAAESRLQGRAARGEPGRGGRLEVARRSPWLVKTRTGSSKPSVASTVSCGCARSTRRTGGIPRSRP